MDTQHNLNNQLLQPPTQKSWLARHFLTELLGLMLAAAVIAGIYYWQTTSNLPSTFDLPKHKSQDSTATWKTYTNIKYNFEIKYPLDWKASISQNVFTVEKSANCYATLTFGGTVNPVWYKNNVYDVIADGVACDNTLNQIFATFKFTK
jgi:hypothetical protein